MLMVLLLLEVRRSSRADPADPVDSERLLPSAPHRLSGRCAIPERRFCFSSSSSRSLEGLLYWLAKNGFLSFRETARALDHPFYLALGFVLNAVTVLIVGYRWYGLLHAQEILVPFRRVISLGFVGLFFNIALPGAVTGDLVKGYYLAKDASGREARAAGTILLDRMLGVGALYWCACAGAMAFANFRCRTARRAAHLRFPVGGVRPAGSGLSAGSAANV